MKTMTPTENVVRAAWNKSLPTPLELGEEVQIIEKGDEMYEEMPSGFVKVLHKDKYSIFDEKHFITKEEFEKSQSTKAGVKQDE